MNNKSAFEVIVEAKKRGDISDYWRKKSVSIPASWKQGSEQEKFEVLSAIRKFYNPEDRNDIRGLTGQTPSQIGQAEGFTQLRYQHAESPQALTVIVKPIAGYSRVIPQNNAIKQ